MVRGEGRKAQKRGSFGTAHKLPSGRYRAMYYGPDGRRYKADRTFLTEKDARGWLSLRQAEIIANSWMPPGRRADDRSTLTLTDYADAWLPKRKVRGQPLKSRTREHYRKLLDQHILPTLGHLPVSSITRVDVDEWYDALDSKTPTLRAHCYGLLSTIMHSAVADKEAEASPCQIPGAGATRRVHKPRTASLAELETITTVMPEHLRAMVLLASWVALRFGELTELRRGDVTIVEPTEDELAEAAARGGDIPMAYGIIRVDRAVVRVKGGFESGTPKSDAGRRDVEVPPHLIPAIKDHLERFTGRAKDALLFPAAGGGHLAPASLYRHFYKARTAANRPDLRWHDLRHSGATMAAKTGATLAELMARLGHSTPAAAMRYQHASMERDRKIAQDLSKMATRNTPN